MLVRTFQKTKVTIVISLLVLLSACAQPAHKNTMPWQLSVAYTEITMVAPNQYLLDGLFYEYDSLKHWLQQRHRAGLQMPLLLTSSDEMNFFKRRNYFEMAAIAQTAEELGFEIYYSKASLWQFKTTSEELLAKAEQQSEPILTEFF